jgi:hypothetical protein
LLALLALALRAQLELMAQPEPLALAQPERPELLAQPELELPGHRGQLA